MKIAIASEHAGYELKEEIIAYLRAKNIEVEDMGAQSNVPINYAPIAMNLGEKVAKGDFEKGILICGTGIGMCMAVGKVPGVRSALCTNEYMAKMTRRHNDANVLCLGAWVTGNRLSLEIADAFLFEDFEGGRHVERVLLIDKLSSKYYNDSWAIKMNDA